MGTSMSEKIEPEQWLSAHGDALYRIALARLRDAVLAEDAVQEALIGAYRSTESFHAQCSERTWLVGILLKKIADCGRARTRRPEDPYDFTTGEFDSNRQWKHLPNQWGDPELELEKTEFRLRFRECLASLPEDFAVAFLLREIQGIDYDEICDTIGITATNLSTRLYRARMLLRTCLDMNWFSPKEDK